MRPQTIKIDLGPIQLRFTLGDADGNGCLDLSLRVRVVGLFELPPVVVNLDAKLAQDAIDAAKKLGDAFKGAKKA